MVTLRAVCITAGVQVRNEVRSHLMLPKWSATAAEKKCFFCCTKAASFGNRSSQLVAKLVYSTAVRSRSNIWDFPLHRQLYKCKTEIIIRASWADSWLVQNSTTIHSHLDYEARMCPSGGHKQNSGAANITRVNMEQEKGGSPFNSISQESVWQVLKHTSTLQWLQREHFIHDHQQIDSTLVWRGTCLPTAVSC